MITTCAQCSKQLSEQQITKILKMECSNNHEHYCSECFNKESIK